MQGDYFGIFRKKGILNSREELIAAFDLSELCVIEFYSKSGTSMRRINNQTYNQFRKENPPERGFKVS